MLVNMMKIYVISVLRNKKKMDNCVGITLKEKLEHIRKHFEEITDEEFNKNLKEAGFEASNKTNEHNERKHLRL